MLNYLKLQSFQLLKWFDLTCGPKIVPEIDPTADPGPTVTWEDGRRYKFNVYPMCGILKKDIPQY